MSATRATSMPKLDRKAGHSAPTEVDRCFSRSLRIQVCRAGGSWAAAVTGGAWGDAERSAGQRAVGRQLTVSTPGGRGSHAGAWRGGGGGWKLAGTWCCQGQPRKLHQACTWQRHGHGRPNILAMTPRSMHPGGQGAAGRRGAAAARLLACPPACLLLLLLLLLDTCWAPQPVPAATATAASAAVRGAGGSGAAAGGQGPQGLGGPAGDTEASGSAWG
jgi:hypothetical protein